MTSNDLNSFDITQQDLKWLEMSYNGIQNDLQRLSVTRAPQRTQRSNAGHAKIGIFFGACANFPRKNVKENMGNKTTSVTQNLPQQIEAFIEICKRKEGKKENLRLFRHEVN